MNFHIYNLTFKWEPSSVNPFRLILTKVIKAAKPALLTNKQRLTTAVGKKQTMCNTRALLSAKSRVRTKFLGHRA